MSLDTITQHAAAAWLVAALVLGIAELAIPGVFAIFLAIAAAATGVTLLAVDLPPLLQLLSFAAWSGVSVLIGKRWYVDYPIATSDPLLNDRSRRLIGQTVTVTQALVGGEGRVRVGDGEWPARGPDADTGAAMQVIAVADGVIEVEPLPALADTPATR